MRDVREIEKLIDEALRADDTSKLLEDVGVMFDEVQSALSRGIVSTQTLGKFVTATTEGVMRNLNDGHTPEPSESIFILELWELLQLSHANFIKSRWIGGTTEPVRQPGGRQRP